MTTGDKIYRSGQQLDSLTCSHLWDFLSSYPVRRFRDPTQQEPLSDAQHWPSARGQLAQREQQTLLRRRSGSSQSGAVRMRETGKPTNGRGV